MVIGVDPLGPPNRGTGRGPDLVEARDSRRISINLAAPSRDGVAWERLYLSPNGWPGRDPTPRRIGPRAGKSTSNRDVRWNGKHLSRQGCDFDRHGRREGGIGGMFEPSGKRIR